ncbi:beta-glucosidase 3B-like [Olea europaea subsp. europaea]|uniref:Beta-glucosidase 3B-like n=1 Tax=Olea europaea subsp. europaea TaxID=158383 RepID=A0A8S0S2X7_OLEEU|nr:beta-glucosidase 3B-like [Olea europaea subsp. europaea]
MGMARLAMRMMILVLKCFWAEAEYVKYKDPKQPLKVSIKDLGRGGGKGRKEVVADGGRVSRDKGHMGNPLSASPFPNPFFLFN